MKVMFFIINFLGYILFVLDWLLRGILNGVNKIRHFLWVLLVILKTKKLCKTFLKLEVFIYKEMDFEWAEYCYYIYVRNMDADYYEKINSDFFVKTSSLFGVFYVIKPFDRFFDDSVMGSIYPVATIKNSKFFQAK
jgi:hypothetical protein